MATLVLGETRACVGAVARVLESMGCGLIDVRDLTGVTDFKFAGPFSYGWPLLTAGGADGISTVCIVSGGAATTESSLHPVRIRLLEQLGRYRGRLICIAPGPTAAERRLHDRLGIRAVPGRVAAIAGAVLGAQPLAEFDQERYPATTQLGGGLYLAALYRLIHGVKGRLFSRDFLTDNGAALASLLIRIQADLRRMPELEVLASCLEAAVQVAAEPGCLESSSFRRWLREQIEHLNVQCSRAFSCFETSVPFQLGVAAGTSPVGAR